MKKNKLFIIGLVTVFVALLSLTLVSSTFAKYVTTSTGTDTARVAKWGVSISAAGNEAFSKEYSTDDTEIKGTIGTSVSSSTKVIAPGTKGNFAAVTVSGTPEVAVKIEHRANVTLANWNINNNEFYCPIVITVKSGEDTTTVKQDETNNSVDALKTAIEDAINKTSIVAPNTNLSVGIDSLEISWEWAFGNGTTDAKDTALGNLGTAPTITVEVVTTVTQID
ncbi:putative uncharacterized protein [Coprobacillus sp. CAG:698]|nr:putative uncharacterized protein [Coprobacillus sp. CAG:698]